MTSQRPLRQDRTHLWILCAITTLGLGLRLLNLTGKPLWTDEFATLVFSLGHGFKEIPLDQVISSEVLLRPLVPDAGFHFGSVLKNLFGESNHPPLYFLLTHLWLHIFPTPNGLVSLWGARSLSALFGAAAIPAIFGLGVLAFRSRWIAQVAALLMATSPLGVYLAQEARHYTLPTLWAIASLACLIIAVRTLSTRRPFPIWIMGTWVVINGLGVATHYFFSLVVIAEGIVIAAIAVYQLQAWCRLQPFAPQFSLAKPTTETLSPRSTWIRIGAVAAGSLASMVVWLPFLEGVQDSEITQWIHRGNRSGLELLDPIFQILAGVITMLYMLPIQAHENPIRVASYAGLVIIAIWTGVKVTQGLRAALAGATETQRQSMQIVGGYVVSAIALFLIVTYGFEREITGAPRYHFVFFPGILLGVAIALVTLWQQQAKRGGRRCAIAIVSLSLVGAICVTTNLGYKKVHRPEVVAQAIRDASPEPTLVAILHRTHGQTGRMMGIAWDLQRDPLPKSHPAPRYLMAHASETPESALTSLGQALDQNPRNLNLWLINFKGLEDDRLQSALETHHCQWPAQIKSAIDGYQYRLYHCDTEPSKERKSSK